MNGSPLGPHQATPAELRERLAAERRGAPFLVLRDGEGTQRLVELSATRERLTLGRSDECDIALPWDTEVSRLHAELERTSGQWLVLDDGISTNGTFVDEVRVSGRRRLGDGDVVRLGTTSIAFRDPAAAAAVRTRQSEESDAALSVTEAQRRVLVALCRPFKGGAVDAVPATNPHIASELFISVPTVKTHLRALSNAFGIDGLPQQEKRRRLVAMAFAAGVVRDSDL